MFRKHVELRFDDRRNGAAPSLSRACRATLVFCTAVFASTTVLAQTTVREFDFHTLRVAPDRVDELRRRSDAALQSREALVERVTAFRRGAEAKGLTLTQALRRAKVDPQLIAAFRADARAQVARADTVRRAWAIAVPSGGLGRLLIAQEPMWLAAESLDFYLRRRLGPSLSTELVALRPYSQRDLLQAGVPSHYIRAISGVGSSASQEGRGLLRDLAREVVLLSARQLADLDEALVAAQENVRSEMNRTDVPNLAARWAWIMAPVNLLIADACKERGPRCRSQQWFVSHRQELLGQASALGWASGEVLLYNRLTGTLDAFVPRFAGAPALNARQRPVDLATLLHSLADPRALGMGDCALAGMVAAGERAMPAVSIAAMPSVAARTGGLARRYVCPAYACDRRAAGPAGAATPRGLGLPLPLNSADDFRASLQDAVLTARWPGLGSQGLQQMRSLCAGATASAQGEVPGAEPNCGFEPVFDAAADPYDHFQTCVAVAMPPDGPQTATGTGVALADLGGIATSPSCRLGDDGAEPAPPAPVPTEEEKKKAEEEKQKQLAAFLRRLAEEASADEMKEREKIDKMLFDTCAKAGATIPGVICYSDAPRRLGETAPTPPPPPPPPPEDPGDDVVYVPASDSGTVIEDWKLISTGYVRSDSDACDAKPTRPEKRGCQQAIVDRADREIDSAIRNFDDARVKRWRGMKAYAESYLSRYAREANGGGRDCGADFARCDSSCSGVERQLHQAARCTTSLLDALLRAAGRPTHGLSAREPWRDSRREQPRPDVDAMAPEVNACAPGPIRTGGATPAGGQACGLVLCTAPGSPGGACCGTSVSNAGRALQDPTCNATRCVDETCACLAGSSARTYSSMPAVSRTPSASFERPRESTGGRSRP